MVDAKYRLVEMLGLLTIIVVSALLLDYLRIPKRRPKRLGLSVAIVGIVLGGGLTLSAVLPDNQVFGKVFVSAPGNHNMVALTFDDGPYQPYTGQILDILAENHIRATFFVVGQNGEKHPELLKRMRAEGHEIGNHTYHHIDLLKARREVILDEVDRTGQVVQSATGYKPTTFRPPHGFRDPVVMEVMAERKLKVVEWSVISRDWTNPGVETIVERVMSKVKNGSIILLHDGDGVAAAASRSQTVEATRRIIAELKAQGYRFVTVNEILNRPEELSQ